ncbi:MAG TPA: hypothetical protein VFN97_24265 [Actinospica sp.]|nr:hypothetical protein [Actinospica sp.]
MSESAAIPTIDDDHALAARRLRDFSFAQVVLLVLQTVLGMRVNLYVQVPAGDQGKGLLSSFGDAMSKGPAEIAAHAGFGMLVFINACLIVVFSLTVRGVAVKLVSTLGWLAIAGAAASGASFINAAPDSGKANQASFVMAALTMLAVVCYAWNLFDIAKGEKTVERAAAAEEEKGAEAEAEKTETEAEAETEETVETGAEAEPAAETAEETEVAAAEAPRAEPTKAD